MSVSEVIKRRREELDLTLLDIAKKIGVSEATVQRYESGTIKNIRQDKILKLAAALQVTPAELLGWDKITQSSTEEKESEVEKTDNDAAVQDKTDTRLTKPDEIIALLEKLADLHSKGVLTKEEYTDKKKDLLERL